jgi:hypothetical protein
MQRKTTAEVRLTARLSALAFYKESQTNLPMVFQAAFHTTFSHRLTWTSSSTEMLVPPCRIIEAKCSSLLFSCTGPDPGFEKSPISVFSACMCLISPGDVWVAPTQTTPDMIVFCGYVERNGSSLPTPFCMITKVVFESATDWKIGGMADGLMALWAQTI